MEVLPGLRSYLFPIESASPRLDVLDYLCTFPLESQTPQVKKELEDLKRDYRDTIIKNGNDEVIVTIIQKSETWQTTVRYFCLDSHCI